MSGARTGLDAGDGAAPSLPAEAPLAMISVWVRTVCLPKLRV